MALITLTSASGSPGVTTTAVGSATACTTAVCSTRTRTRPGAGSRRAWPTRSTTSPAPSSGPLAAVIARLRADVPALEQDRYLAPDLAKAAELVRTDALVGALPAALLAEVRP